MSTVSTESGRGKQSPSLYRKVAWRIMPLLCVMYFAAFIDRVALGYAMPQGLASDLGLTATMFGFASGVFFIGYILLEVPSNALLVKFGSRVWLTRIMVSWGALQALTAFVTTPEMLYVLRFLLGVAEAGFAPGMLYFLTLWFPTNKLGRMIGITMAVPTITNMVGPFLGNGLIALGNSLSWDVPGWRFMIFVTGILAVVIGVVVFMVLSDRPSQARWLSEDERASWTATIDGSQLTGSAAPHRFMESLKSPWPWIVGALYFVVPFSVNALIFFLPTMATAIAEQIGLADSVLAVSALTSIPYLISLVALLVFAIMADRTGRHGWVVSIGLSIGVIGAVVLVLGQSSSWVSLIALSMVAIAASSLANVIIAMVPKFARATGVAAAMALVVSLGNIGGFTGPYVTGFLIDSTGYVYAGMWVTAGVMAVGAVIAPLIDRGLAKRFAAGSTTPAVTEQPGTLTTADLA